MLSHNIFCLLYNRICIINVLCINIQILDSLQFRFPPAIYGALSLTANNNHCQPRWVTVSLISPQVDTSVIKSLAEAAFLSSFVVAVATTAVPEPVTTATVSSEIPSPSTSEPSSSVAAVTASKAPVATVTELLLLQFWEFCGYSQLPTATILPVLLLKDQGCEKDVSCLSIPRHTVKLFIFYYRFVFFTNSILKTL